MYEPALTVFNDAAPCPRVEVYFGSLYAGTATLTVTRTSEERVYKVRGMVGAPAAGTFSRIDYEVPFNTPVSYQAECFNDAGVSLGFTGATTITVVSRSSWIHNVFKPDGATRVEFRQDSFRELNRPVSGTVVYPEGAVAGVLTGGQRRGLTDLQVSIQFWDEINANRVQGMFGGYGVAVHPVVCVRVGSDTRVRLPKPLYLAVTGNVTERADAGFSAGLDMIPLAFRGDEITPPAPGVAMPTVTYADVAAAYPTYEQTAQNLRTYEAWSRAYTLRGRGK